ECIGLVCFQIVKPLRALHDDEVLSRRPAHALAQGTVDEARHGAVVGDSQPLALDLLQTFHSLFSDDAEADLTIGSRNLQPLGAAIGEDRADHRNAAVDAEVGVVHTLSAHLDRSWKLSPRPPHLPIPPPPPLPPPL